MIFGFRGWTIVVIALVGLLGCGDTERRGGGSDVATLHVGNGGEPKSLDPHLVTGDIEHRLLGAFFEGLTTLDLLTMEPIPATAESWTISDDGTVYTFTIRNAARWSNGDAVTAHDFVYAWRRILSPGLAAEYAYMLYPLKNAEEFHAGLITDFAEVGARAIDDRTLEVTLRAPTPYFLSLHIHFTWFPLHRATIEKFGRFDERDTAWTRPDSYVGNGPYQLAEWRPTDRIVAEKNTYYWNAANVAIERVQFHPIADPAVEERSFRAGGLDLTYAVPLTKLDSYRANQPESLRIDPYLGVEFIRFNTARPPLDDLNVRRALAMAIDRATIVNKVMRAGQRPAAHFVPPDTAGYTSTFEIPYDPEQARRHLAEAGYPGGKGFPRVTMIYDTGENRRLYCEAIQAMWKAELGIEVALQNVDTKTWLANMIARDYDIARSTWYGDYIDPSNFLDMFYGASGNNRTGFNNSDYETLLRQAALALDPEERNATYQRAETLLLSEVPIAPVFFHTRPYLVGPELENVQSNPLGLVNLKAMRLRR